MPMQQLDSAIIRPDLGVVVDEFREGFSGNMIGGLILPFFRVPLQSAGYPVIPKEVLLKKSDTKRAPGGAYPRADWDFESGIYATSENGWEEKIDDRTRKLYTNMFDLESVASRRAMRKVMTTAEERVASLVFSASRFSAHAVGNKWSDPVNATPIDDVTDAISAVELQCGMKPNTLIMDTTTFRLLKRTDQIVEQIKYTFPGADIQRMTESMLAALFDLKQVLVGGGVYDSAAQGMSASLARFWPSTQVMLTKVAEFPDDLEEPCIGRTFYWDSENGGESDNKSAIKTVVETYRDEPHRSDIIRVRHDSDERLLASYDNANTIKSDIAAAVSYRMTNIQ